MINFKLCLFLRQLNSYYTVMSEFCLTTLILNQFLSTIRKLLQGVCDHPNLASFKSSTSFTELFKKWLLLIDAPCASGKRDRSEAVQRVETRS